MNHPQINPLRTHKAQSGSILSVVLISILPLAALVASVTMRSAMEIKTYSVRRSEYSAIHQAQSGIEYARSIIRHAGYNSSGDNALLATATMGGTDSFRRVMDGGSGSGYLGIDLLTGKTVPLANPQSPPLGVRPYVRLTEIPTGNSPTAGRIDEHLISVYVASLGNKWFAMESVGKAGGLVRTMRTYFRERGFFSEFNLFIDQNPVNLASIPDGRVHSNSTLNFVSSPMAFNGFVSSAMPFTYGWAAAPETTHFLAGSMENAPPIPMPTVSHLANLQAIAMAPFNIGANYTDVAITLLQEDIEIVATDSSTGIRSTLYSGGIPQKGLIYVESGLSQFEGDINGRLTIATPGTVRITDSVRYIDENGEYAMANASSPSLYGHNPNYTGNSALGLITGEDVLYTNEVGMELELNFAAFVGRDLVLEGAGIDPATGVRDGTYDATFLKEDLCIFGSRIVARNAFNHILNTATETALSGFPNRAMLYDRALTASPPPYFVELPFPLFLDGELMSDTVPPPPMPANELSALERLSWLQRIIDFLRSLG